MSQVNMAPSEAPRQSLLARRPLRRFLLKIFAKWRERHRHPFNFAIHIPGILIAVSGVVLLFLRPWYWGVGALVLGYFLQWLGHVVEGNDVGEWAAIKRMLGLPYTSVAPRWQQDNKQPVAP
jgi:hypothetical protein